MMFRLEYNGGELYGHFLSKSSTAVVQSRHSMSGSCHWPMNHGRHYRLAGGSQPGQAGVPSGIPCDIGPLAPYALRQFKSHEATPNSCAPMGGALTRKRWSTPVP